MFYSEGPVYPHLVSQFGHLLEFLVTSVVEPNCWKEFIQTVRQMARGPTWNDLLNEQVIKYWEMALIIRILVLIYSKKNFKKCKNILIIKRFISTQSIETGAIEWDFLPAVQTLLQLPTALIKLPSITFSLFLFICFLYPYCLCKYNIAYIQPRILLSPLTILLYPSFQATTF